MNLEEDVEPFLDPRVSNKYWCPQDGHSDFRKIVDAIDTGGGQTCNVPGVLKELDKAGYVIRKI